MSYDADMLDGLLSVKGKGEELLKTWGSMMDIWQNVDALKVTPRQRDVLKAAKVVRFIREEKVMISSPADIFPQVEYLALEPAENLVVLGLDRRNNLIGKFHIYKGSVNSSQVRIGELFRDAIIRNCLSIVLAHNHPSGDPTPSPDDVALTREVVKAGKLLDIELLDHLVVGHNGKWVSLKEHGLGFGY